MQNLDQNCHVNIFLKILMKIEHTCCYAFPHSENEMRCSIALRTIVRRKREKRGEWIRANNRRTRNKIVN